MRREIEFRKWHKELEDMTFWDGSVGSNNLFWHTLTQFPDMYILEQYTGLTDKNGVKIFEGDKVKKTAWYLGSNSKKPNESIGQVKWNNESASFLFYVGHYLGLTADNVELEIIGNIHEQSKEVSNA